MRFGSLTNHLPFALHIPKSFLEIRKLIISLLFTSAKNVLDGVPYIEVIELAYIDRLEGMPEFRVVLRMIDWIRDCLLYTSDAADEL